MNSPRRPRPTHRSARHTWSTRSIAWLWAAVPSGLLAAAGGPDTAVESGRKALDGWGGFPWYDAASDDVRRIDVSAPYDWSWLADWLPKFSIPNSFLQCAAWLLLAVLLGVLLYYLIGYFLARRRSLHASDGKELSETAIQYLPIAVQDARGDLLAEATRLYQQGDFAQAVLYLFSYQLSQLDKHQFIRLAKGKTNRQYLREVPRMAGLRGLLEQTMVAFEDVFFGNHAISRARFEACWAEVPRFQALLRETRP